MVRDEAGQKRRAVLRFNTHHRLRRQGDRAFDIRRRRVSEGRYIFVGHPAGRSDADRDSRRRLASARVGNSAFRRGRRRSRGSTFWSVFLRAIAVGCPFSVGRGGPDASAGVRGHCRPIGAHAGGQCQARRRGLFASVRRFYVVACAGGADDLRWQSEPDRQRRESAPVLPGLRSHRIRQNRRLCAFLFVVAVASFVSCPDALHCLAANDQAARYGFIEFELLSSVATALALSGSMLGDRAIKVGKANNPIVKSGGIGPEETVRVLMFICLCCFPVVIMRSCTGRAEEQESGRSHEESPVSE